jgi:hypothetical protein
LIHYHPLKKTVEVMGEENNDFKYFLDGRAPAFRSFDERPTLEVLIDEARGL